MFRHFKASKRDFPMDFDSGSGRLDEDCYLAEIRFLICMHVKSAIK